MKKSIFLLLFWAMMVPMMAQYNFMTISGTITDISSGAPVANQAVSIYTDSTTPAGFYYNNVVYTFSNGFYVDTIPFNTGYIPSGLLVVTTMDCQNYPHTGSFYFSPGNQAFVLDFQICTYPAPCNADFGYQAAPNSLTMQFTDQSTGSSNFLYSWNFGDGYSSNDMNPAHTYAQPGFYNVVLMINDSSVACWDSETKLIQVGDSTNGGCTANFYSVPDSSNPMMRFFFDQSTGNNIVSWAWNFGDGTPVSVTQNPAHIYVQPGIYTVCLTIQSIQNNGSTCTSTFCDEIVVGNSTGCQAYFNAFPDSSNLLNIQFIDQSSGNNINSWFWSFGDGTSIYQQNPVHHYIQPGTYLVCLTIHGSDSTCYDNYCQSIVVGNNSGCQAYFNAFPDSSNLMNIQFIDQSSGNTINNWLWSFGDGTSSSQQNPVHLFNQPGTYTVCLTIHGNDSTCYDNYCQSIVVGNNPGCQAQFTWYADSANNSLSTVHFIDLSIGGGSTWFWDFGDSTYSTVQNPDHVYAQQGTYYVCLTITGSNPSCQSTWCTNVTAGGSTGCASYFTFSQNQLNVAFEGHMVNGLPAVYAWGFGDGTGGNGENVTHNYSIPGMYYVTLTTTSNNCTYTSGQTIQVGDSGAFSQVYGQVFEGDFSLSSGIAMIFSIDSVNAVPYFDIALIDSMGVYSFPYVPQGNFVVWVIPTDASDYLPTYYGDVLFWQQASVITLGQPVNPYNIHLILAGDNSGGPGEINGHINSMLKNGLNDKIRMIITNEQGNAIGFANVSSAGDFDFASLSFGVYFLRAELPGTTSDLIRVEITHENPIVNVVLTYSGNHLLGINDPVSAVKTLTFYPNPFNDVINVKAESNSAMSVNISLSDMAGRSILSWSENLIAGNNHLKLNTSGLQAGIYILSITAADGTHVIQKMVKTR